MIRARRGGPNELAKSSSARVPPCATPAGISQDRPGDVARHLPQQRAASLRGKTKRLLVYRVRDIERSACDSRQVRPPILQSHDLSLVDLTRCWPTP